MKSTLIVFLSSTLLAALSSHALAAPVSYDESISGDLSFSGPLFTFDAGINTVSGSSSDSSDPNIDWDQDGWKFIIPTGMSLTSITFEWQMTGTESEARLIQSGRFLGLGCTTCGNDWANIFSTWSVGSGLEADTSPVNLFTTKLPLGPGTYLFSDKHAGQGPWGSWDYTFTFDVAVPIPAAAWLFGSALFGLVAVKRRKK